MNRIFRKKKTRGLTCISPNAETKNNIELILPKQKNRIQGISVLNPTTTRRVHHKRKALKKIGHSQEK